MVAGVVSNGVESWGGVSLGCWGGISLEGSGKLEFDRMLGDLGSTGSVSRRV